ncbi:acyl-CoA carboxylase subunit epsilon [Arthrobacter sp. H41]|uniref:acyl-CoA carboxylase subunit epsilon n=1 Tax=Arthrobacter sp. H41 TaxID=1312978 RepID=UPI0020A67BD1|nr:acyl-CoA carboxylase subunit epsilon [Arthrobacter sp. H41]
MSGPGPGLDRPTEPAELPEPSAEAAGGSTPALLSVVAGNPTDEELAALTAVVVALQGSMDTDSGPSSGRSWLRRAMLRLNPRPGPGSWKRSAR